MKYTTKKIKKMFLTFFKQRKHQIITSSSLIPPKNSNLLFTNAGMNQFQNIFLGKEKYQFQQIVTIQKCLRTGGKHNDLEQVGYSKYHNTFFEMLGNFSFGGYFKKKAILYSWKLLTHRKWFNITKNKLFVTVYKKDKETYKIWRKIIKIPKKQIIKIGDKKNKKYQSDNFWSMGETGPCGPCTEIFFNTSSNDINNTINLKNKKKYLEVWNIVFIEFNKIKSHHLIPLQKKSIDTGMGLERIASILQKKYSNYKTDIFQKLINYIYQLYNIYPLKKNYSINIIADHIRAAIFMIADGITPSNEHRGYILRRIIRRSLIHGQKLGIKNIFLYKLVHYIIFNIYQEHKYLQKQHINITNIIKTEELNFFHTLKNGLNFLTNKIKNLTNKELDSKIVFYLYDTLGFPIDLTKDICLEKNIYINDNNLKKILIQHKNNHTSKNKNNIKYIIQSNITTQFDGYLNNTTHSYVKEIYINNQKTPHISYNEKGILVLDKTPFYGESGGQVGDTGIIFNKKFIFQVTNSQNFINTICHIGYVLSGKIIINDTVIAKINKKKRFNIQNNHSATHLLHAILKNILQYNIQQKGSFINENYLRFDFYYPFIIHKNQIITIEKILNEYIQKNIIIQSKYKNFTEAKKNNFCFLKNKTYNTIVRTLKIGNISKEICKGTHSNNTGEIGIFKIISIKKISSYIYRIEAKTGSPGIQKIQQQILKLKKIQNIFKSNNKLLIPKITTLIKKYSIIKKKNYNLTQEIILYTINNLITKIIKIKNINILLQQVKIKNPKLLKNIIDQIKNKIQDIIIILFYKKNNKYIFIVYVSKNITIYIQATQIIEIIKKKTNGMGGGKIELAECVAYNIQNILLIINKIKYFIKSKL